MQKRFLWGGVAMILVASGFAFLAMARPMGGGPLSPVVAYGFPRGSVAPLAAAASFALLAGVLLLLLRAFLKSSEDVAKQRLDGYRAEITAEMEKSKEDQEQRFREIADAHNDLLTHHKLTKKMLQSYRATDVFETLLKGVREGFGFPGAVLGVLEEKGTIVFRSAGNGEGRPGKRIPCWEEESLLARTIWSGNPVMIPSLDGQRHSGEDRAILGEGPAFLVPVTKKPSRKCSDVMVCGLVECPAYHLLDAKCWIEGLPARTCTQSGEIEQKRKECARCEMFLPSAILVVRSHPGSRKISRETTGSIVALANEAGLALKLAEMNENTRKMSITDGLTGILNHRGFYELLGRELERARRYGHSVSLLMVDVDDFKKFNDRYGHLAGDSALKKIAELIRGSVRANDIVARYGGEEFGVILPEATPAGALMLAERIKTDIACHRFPGHSGEVAHLTVSIGIYSTDPGDITEERMVKFADEAAYLAKHSGKNRVVVKSHA